LTNIRNSCKIISKVGNIQKRVLTKNFFKCQRGEK
jgi:hypothetical protein